MEFPVKPTPLNEYDKCIATVYQETDTKDTVKRLIGQKTIKETGETRNHRNTYA